MEMVEMETKLIKLDFSDEQEAVFEFSKKIKKEVNKFIKNPKLYAKKKNNEIILDHDEFLEILNKAVELKCIDKNKKESINKSLETEYTKKVFKIFSITMSVGGVLSLTVIGNGIKEFTSKFIDLFFEVWNNKISIFEAISEAISEVKNSDTSYLYAGKLLLMALIPYIVWWKSKVKYKIPKSIVNMIPIIGGWIFPFLAMIDHRIFYKFWRKIYSEIKEDHREMKKNPNTERKYIFEKKLIKKCKEQFSN